MERCYGIILAAGEGKRMKSRLPKVLHKVCGKAMLDHVIESVNNSGLNDFIVVTGHGSEIVKTHLGDNVKTAYQEKQLGTGHAVMCCEDFLKSKDGTVIILAGDVPLITDEIISKVFEYHNSNKCSATILTASVDNPTGFGRIIRDEYGNIEKIVEHKDASDEERKVDEVNSGTYCFDIKALLDALKNINNDNKQGEYYLTDAIEIIKRSGKTVGAYKTSYGELMGVTSEKEVPSVFMGVNSRLQLSEASEVMRKRILIGHMNEGVTVIDASSTYVDSNIKIGRDTILYPGTLLEGNTFIGEGCIIGPNSRIVDSTIEDEVKVEYSVVLESNVKNGSKIGPFAYIRPESTIGENVKIGDFVEVKKSTIGSGTKVSHLTYIGDSDVGEGCNFGCGTVVVNYNGTSKFRTKIGDNSFIGCNTNLISPVEVGDNSYIAAGSTITDNVPDGALAIARAKQVNKEGWVEKKKIWKK